MRQRPTYQRRSSPGAGRVLCYRWPLTGPLLPQTETTDYIYCTIVKLRLRMTVTINNIVSILTVIKQYDTRGLFYYKLQVLVTCSIISISYGMYQSLYQYQLQAYKFLQFIIKRAHRRMVLIFLNARNHHKGCHDRTRLSYQSYDLR